MAIEKSSVTPTNFKKDIPANTRYDRRAQVSRSTLSPHLISFINTMNPQVKIKLPKANFKQVNNAVLSLP